VFAGLAGRLLAGPLEHPSAALTGLAIFVNFGTGVLVQTTTTRWPARRLIAAGIVPTLVGLVVLVVSAWTASLALFFLAAVIGGAGGGAIFRGSLVLAVSTADPAERAGALATYFTAGYLGVSLPVIGLGVALQYVTPLVALLIFAVIVGIGILAAAPVLTGARNQRPKGER
jgi:MFS family permease